MKIVSAGMFFCLFFVRLSRRSWISNTEKTSQCQSKAGQCPGSWAIILGCHLWNIAIFWYWQLKKERFREAAQWILLAKSGMDGPKKSIQVKKWRNIRSKSNYWMFEINIWSGICNYKVNESRMLWIWIFKSFATNAIWCIRWKGMSCH